MCERQRKDNEEDVKLFKRKEDIQILETSPVNYGQNINNYQNQSYRQTILLPFQVQNFLMLPLY